MKTPTPDNFVDRRDFIKLTSLSGLALYLQSCASWQKDGPAHTGHFKKTFAEISPIDRQVAQGPQTRFSGDNPQIPHHILWDKEPFLAANPSESVEEAKLVIIGGGMSGLISAYELQDLKPIILEQAPRMGGNSKGESWQGLDYSIGAAYFIKPDKGSDQEDFLKRSGIMDIARAKEGFDPVVYKGKRYSKFWQGETTKSKAYQFKKLHRYFEDVYYGRNGQFYPEIPITDPKKLQASKVLDKQTFKEHLEKYLGEKLHPHIEATLEHFCWSSFGTPFCEVSALAGLNFYTGEFGNLLVTPGGNAGAAEKILSHLVNELPADHLRTQTLVVDVKVDESGATIKYVDPALKVHTIRAKAVIMACPKFVVGKILQDIEPTRLESFSRLRYHAYLVANVLINSPIKDDFYDLFLIGQGKLAGQDIQESSTKQKVTDVVYGNFAMVNNDRSVLTLYRAFPYDGARPELYAEDSFAKYKEEFAAQVENEILPLVGKTKEEVVDMRLTRWGHPLPSADRGLIADGVINELRRPFKERVFFVEQDNWMLPAFETAMGEALLWSKEVRRYLGA